MDVYVLYADRGHYLYAHMSLYCLQIHIVMQYLLHCFHCHCFPALSSFLFIIYRQMILPHYNYLDYIMFFIAAGFKEIPNIILLYAYNDKESVFFSKSLLQSVLKMLFFCQQGQSD